MKKLIVPLPETEPEAELMAAVETVYRVSGPAAARLYLDATHFHGSIWCPACDGTGSNPALPNPGFAPLLCDLCRGEQVLAPRAPMTRQRREDQAIVAGNRP